MLTPRPNPKRARTAEKSARVDDKRSAIVEAALALFVERGFHGTAVPEIADRAGVGAGTIYRYFASKEALVNALYQERKMAFANAVLHDFPGTAPTREQFHVLWSRMARFATDDTASFVFLEMHHHAPYLDDASRAVETRMTELFLDVIGHAQARHELKKGPARLLMGIVVGAFLGVMRSSVEAGVALERTEWRLAEQCAWEAVRA